jgi:hypothetical protein
MNPGHAQLQVTALERGYKAHRYPRGGWILKPLEGNWEGHFRTNEAAMKFLKEQPIKRHCGVKSMRRIKGYEVYGGWVDLRIFREDEL